MNHSDKRFSDEFLNAYIDDELADEDRQRLMEALRDDQLLNQRLCSLRTVRDLVRLGFQHAEGDNYGKTARTRRFGWGRSVAALLFVGLGVGAGWLTHSGLSQSHSLMDIARTVEVSQADQTNQHPVRIMLHVTTDDRFKLATVLDEAEQLLGSDSGRGNPVQVAILANGDGLNLLRADESPFAERLQALKARYENLSLLACGKALQRLHEHQGQTPPLLPRTEVVPSALGEIIHRRQDGWSYIMI